VGSGRMFVEPTKSFIREYSTAVEREREMMKRRQRCEDNEV
jgi:hypothetical protein